jgi:hypothetical protein
VLNKKTGLEFRLFQAPGVKINVSLKQGVDRYCLIDNFKHISRKMCPGSFASRPRFPEDMDALLNLRRRRNVVVSTQENFTWCAYIFAKTLIFG